MMVRAALHGGRADGLTCLVHGSPAMITMVDGVPKVGPSQPGREARELLRRAYGTWECYAVDLEAEPEPTGAVPYRCTRAIEDGPR